MIDNTINGRTPEEIKRGLECCKPVWVDDHWKTCDTKCPYIDDVGGFCRAQLMADALALIQQLERERDAAVAEIESLNAETDAINEDYLRGIHTAREDAWPKWISVEERLPEESFNVLMLFKHNMAAGWYGGEGDWYSNTDDGFYASCDGEPTHWMPLPEPPKEG